MTVETRPTRVRTSTSDRLRVLRLAPSSVGGVAPEVPWLHGWLAQRSAVDVVSDVDALVAVLRRARPSVVLLDASDARVIDACHRCKRDPHTALVPCVVLDVDATTPDPVTLLRAGADEVLRADTDPAEGAARLDTAIARARRDLSAQATTGLPGPPAIEAVLTQRLRDGATFAACYADLDHFKEYNDRYGFREGDRVIRMIARVLYDAAIGFGGDDAFVGHIGGDDFLCVLPLATAADTCALIVETFDLLAPLQYNAADRRAGYYLGKDRRGVLHRVPLMSVSLGVATTERRHFRSAEEVSRLASEMKSFAKTQPGSVFAFDRRGDDSGPPMAPFAEIV